MPGTIKGITIQLGADTTKLSSALNQANKSIKSCQTELRSLDKALKFEPGNAALLGDKMNVLREKTEAAKQKVEALKQAQQQLDAAGVDKNSEQYQKLQTEIDEAEAEVRQLEAETRNFGSVGAQQVAAVGEKLKTIGQGISDLGQKLTVGLTLPLVGIGTKGVKSFAEVDKTMQLTNKTMGNTEKEAQMLDKAMKDAASNSTFGMNDAATATLNFARAGLDAEQASAALAPAMNLAAGEGGNLDTVSAGLVATINGFHGSFDEAAQYADVFANACNNSALDVDSLSSAMSTVAPVFQAAGYNVNDAALYMGVMANNGIEASVAANSLKSGLGRLLPEAKGGKVAMEKFGWSILDSNGNMKDSVTVQAELHDAFSNLSEAEQVATAQAMFGTTQYDKWLALINTAPEEVQALSDSLTDQGTVAKMAEAMMSGFGGSIESLKSSIDVAATSLGQALAPMVGKVIASIQKAVDWFNSLDSAQQQTVAKIGLVVAAIGPLLVIIGKLISAVGSVMVLAPKIKAGFIVVKTAITAASTSVGGFSGALAALASPVAIAVAAIVGIGAAVATLWKTNEDFRNKITAMWDSVSNKFSSACQRITGVINSFGFSFKGIADAIKSAWQALCNFLAPVFEGAFRTITTTIEGLIDIVTGVVEVIGGVIHGFASGDWTMAWQGICDIAIGLFNTLTAPIQGVLQAICSAFGVDFEKIKNVVSTVFSFVRDHPKEALNVLKQTVSTVLEAVKGFFQSKLDGIKSTVSNVMNAVKQFFSTALDTIKNKASTILEAVRNFFQTKLEAAKFVVQNALNTIKQTFQTVLEAVKSKVSTILEAVKNFFQTKLQAAKSIVDSALKAIQKTFETVLNAIKNKVSTILEAIKNYFQTKLQAIKSIVDNALNAIKQAFETKLNDIKNKVSNVLESINSTFKSKLDAVKNTVSSAFTAIFNTAKSKLDDLLNKVKGVIDSIKSLFNISLKLDIKLPHISVDGGEAPYGIGGKGKLPTFHVEWYDKGGIFNSPTIIGVGEKRPEFVGALDDLRAIVREESGGGALMQEMVRLMTIMVEQGGRPITVNQEIYAESTSYAEQQKQAAREFRNIARALA